MSGTAASSSSYRAAGGVASARNANSIAAVAGRRGGRAKPKMTLTTRLAIAMIALVAAAVSAVGWLSYRSLEQALLPRVLDRIETQFAAGCHQSGIPCPQRAWRHCNLSRTGGGHGIDACPHQWRDGSGRQHHRSALARTAWQSTGRPDGRSSRPIHCASSASKTIIGKSFASTARDRTAPSASCRKPS